MSHDNGSAGRGGHLRLLAGGLHRRLETGHLQIVSAPGDAPPFPVEAICLEEDTFLIMSAETSEPHETMHPIRLMMELQNAEPRRTGSIIVRKGSPVKLLAIVHDVNEEPITREEWVAEALQGLFEKAEELGISSISMPLLAARHGRLPATRLAQLLAGTLERKRPFLFPRKLWVTAPVPDNAVFMDALEKSLLSHERL